MALAQVVVETSENELNAVPQLLDKLDLWGRIVTGDALFTQHNLSARILSLGGHYLWPVKDNQQRLHNDVWLFFMPPRKAPGWFIKPLRQEAARTGNNAHGQLEQRILTSVVDETGFLDWPSARQVLKQVRQVITLATGTVTVQEVYGVTSLPPR